MAVDLTSRNDPDHLMIFAMWLMEKRANDPAVAALYHHDIRTKAAVKAGLLDKSYLGGAPMIPATPSPFRGQAVRIDKHFTDWMTGFVPLRPSKRAQSAERQSPAMSASTYANLFKC